MKEGAPVLALALQGTEFIGDLRKLVLAEGAQAAQTFLADGEFLRWQEMLAVRRILQPAVLGKGPRMGVELGDLLHRDDVAEEVVQVGSCQHVSGFEKRGQGSGLGGLRSGAKLVGLDQRLLDMAEPPRLVPGGLEILRQHRASARSEQGLEQRPPGFGFGLDLDRLDADRRLTTGRVPAWA